MNPNAFLTNVAEELTVSALWTPGFGERGVTRISFAIGIAVAALSTMQAMAADLGRLPPPGPFYPAAPVVRVYNWTGCYLGGQLGGAFANNQLSGQATVPVQDPGAIPPVPAMTTPISQNAGSTSVIAGGQGGCDLQFARNWVIGAQLDGVWTHLAGSQGVSASQGIANQGTNSSNATLGVNANIIATATGRIGYATDFDSLAGLFYLKGGAAFINYNTYNINGQVTTVTCHPNSFNPQQGCGAFDSPVSTPFSFNAPSASRWGWTIGLGTEWVVAGNWSVFGEWDYLNFGTHSATFTDTNAGSTQISVKQNINELKLGVNYRFGDPPPGYR